MNRALNPSVRADAGETITSSDSPRRPIEQTARVRSARPYTPPARRSSELPILALDANEGPAPDPALIETLHRLDAELLRRYPRAADLEARLAAHWSIDPERIVVTNGGDEVINRICLAFLEPGRELLTHEPTFEMIGISARLAGADIRSIDWMDGPFPTQRFIDSIGPTTRLVAIVSPNNPTGLVIEPSEMFAIAAAARANGAVVLVDLAYVEFADIDPTRDLLALDNVIAARTFSKARSLAGLRVGYAIASRQIAAWLRAVGGPYPVSNLSLAIAAASLDMPARTLQTRTEAIGMERQRLTRRLADLGAAPLPSQANFVTARVRKACFVQSGLLALGIAVRAFENRPGLENVLRITLPGNDAEYARLDHALQVLLRPQAMLFDLDGVIADVSASYRSAIIQTARAFGGEVSADDVAAAKRAVNANNDWLLTQQLLHDRGIEVAIETITQRFQSIYLGTEDSPALRDRERLIAAPGLLRRLFARIPLGIVTGRPCAEARWFLERHGVLDCFATLVCMEDAPAKPSPEPVRLALRRLEIDRAWMIGDTPDDIRAAALAGVVPLGIAPPGDAFPEARLALEQCGAARVLITLDELETLLP